MIRKKLYSNWIRLTDVWSTEFKESRSAKPSKDHARCFAIVHQLQIQSHTGYNQKPLGNLLGISHIAVLPLFHQNEDHETPIHNL